VIFNSESAPDRPAPPPSRQCRNFGSLM